MIKPEDILREAFLLELPRAFADARFFYRNIINRRVRDLHTNREYQLVSGSAGMADLFGYARGSPVAIPFEIELKSWSGSQTKEQRAWQRTMVMIGVPFLLLKQKKGETTSQTISRWISEVKALLNSIRAQSPPTSTTRSKPSSTACPPDEPPTAATSETPSA